MSSADQHAAAMDAHAYWRNFAATWDPTEDDVELIGTLEHLGEKRLREEFFPWLKIRTDKGTLFEIIASQKMLRSELVRYRPRVGDRIWIKYLGVAKKAAPGMNPTQLYKVAVQDPDGNRRTPVE